MIVVIGHYPAYVQTAEARGLRYFQVEMTLWNSWTADEQWSANCSFLDAACAVDAVFVLATPPAEVKPGSWYARELDYLRSKGYQARLNGLDWELFR